MPEGRWRITPPIFVVFWFLLNILPAALAELTSDEGYYWFLANTLQWGYYDHPPMLALLVSLGTQFASGELGVRLLSVIFSTLGLVLLFTMIPRDPKQQRWAYLIILSIPLLSYLSIFILPDGPLLLFCLLFLYGYRRFLEREDATAILVMGLAMGLMAYSKYHGVLVVLLTVLSNPRLLKSRGFYAAGAIALVLFLPHLVWQAQHDFITFRYHLTGRARPFKPGFFFDYVLQQLLAFGPAILFVPFVVTARDRFERALKFIAVGTFVFFLLSTLRGFVHTHWTSIAVYPTLLLAVGYYSTRSSRWALALMVPWLVGGLLGRVYLVHPIVPITNQGIDYYHDRDLWAEDVQSLAGTDAVIFFRDFRQAPLYTFYTGRPGVALFPGDDRQSQYELWHYEDSLQGRAVTWVQYVPMGGDTLTTRMGQTLRYLRIPAFASYYNLRMTAELPDTLGASRDSVPAHLVLYNHRDTPVTFPPNPLGSRPGLFVRMRGPDGELQVQLQGLTNADTVPPGGARAFDAGLPLGGLPAGRYTMEFGISAHPQGAAYNTAVITVVLTD